MKSAFPLLVTVLLMSASLGLSIEAPFGSPGDDIRFASGTKLQASVTLVADANGSLQLDRSSTITIGGGPNPNPTPNPDPDPSPDLTRSKLFQKASESINDPQTAKILGAFYRQLATETKSGKIKTPEELTVAVGIVHDLVFRNQQTGEALTKWNPFKSLLQSQWTLTQQSGGLLSDYSKLLEDASDGLDASAPDAAAIDMTAIIQIIQIVLDPSLTPIQKVLKALPLILKLIAFQEAAEAALLEGTQ